MYQRVVRVETDLGAFDRLFDRHAFQGGGATLSAFQASPRGAEFAAAFADANLVPHVIQFNLFSVRPFCILSGHLGRSCNKVSAAELLAP